MKPTDDRRSTAGYELTAESREIVHALSVKKGMKKKDMVQRVMGWLAEQEPVIQSVVLGLVDPGMENAYADALVRLADRLRKSGSTPPRAAGR